MKRGTKLMNKRAGIIAGGGMMPVLVAQSMREKGLEPVIMCSSQEKLRSPQFSSLEEEIRVFELGNLAELTQFIDNKGIGEIVFAGKFPKTDFLQIIPDKAWAKIFANVSNFQNEEILSALIEHFEENGITVSSQAKFLEGLVATSGALVGQPTKEELEDIAYGFKMAKIIADLDIGQTVVVKKKTVFAVEAIDGTNETLLRGGKLAQEGAVAVKVSRTNQDWRVDVATIGAETVKTAIDAGIKVLALEAEKTILLEKDEAFQLARENGLSIYGYLEK